MTFKTLSARHNDESGEVSSWLILMAGLVAAAVLAIAILNGTITELASAVGHGPVDVGAGVDQADQQVGPAGPGEPAGPLGPDEPLDPGTRRDNPALREALEAAGIDFDEWNPAAGAEANREIIEAVYTYYGDLFLEDENMQWAGMANMIGPSFAAGFFDLAQMQDVITFIGDNADRIAPHLVRDGVDFGAELTAEELRWYETKFLDMQRQIFIDQAPAHQAYRTQGFAGIEQLRSDGLIDQQMYNAWETIHRGIESGDRALIAEGNLQLLRREQFDIIDDDYQEMYDRPLGPVITYAMTTIGRPSIPGAHGYGEIFPITVTVESPGPRSIGLGPVRFDNPLQGSATLITPFPNGNIAEFDDRWRLIIEDTLPAYREVLDDGDAAQDIVRRPVADRIEEQRLDIVNVVDELTDFGVDLDQ